MSANAPGSAQSPGRPLAPELRGGAYTGWLVSGLIILAVLAVGAALWFIYHP
ncbi:MAG TPA: hypothetical protein VMI55_05380 [Thermoplasmata archaeon]|nr:hypothetical protein [Thermoplasmata archaeon]